MTSSVLIKSILSKKKNSSAICLLKKGSIALTETWLMKQLLTWSFIIKSGDITVMTRHGNKNV